MLVPLSVRHTYQGDYKGHHFQMSTCNDARHVDRSMEHQSISEGGEVIFTYDVKWEESNIRWADRWDKYGV